jgi:uncharacterized protein YbaA (DUF1428 family)
MAYVDGFLIPVPRKNIEACRRIARRAGKIWKDPRMTKLMNHPKAMPFDYKRMAFGGFKVLVDL